MIRSNGIASYLSATNITPNFNLKGSIASPRDLPTLGLFQGLQRLVNAYASAYNFPRIAEDGDIGPATLQGVKMALGLATVASGTAAPINPATTLLRTLTGVKALAEQAGSVGEVLSDLRNLPFNTSADPNKRPVTAQTIPGAEGTGGGAKKPAPPPPSGGGFNWMAALAVVAIGGGAYLYSRRGKRA